MYHLIKKVKICFQSESLQGQAREDMIMWEQFLQSYNGTSMFLPKELVTETELKVQVSVA